MSEMSTDLIEQIAQIIAPEAFRDFSDCVVYKNGEAKPYKPSGLAASRLAYQRAEALCKAVHVLAALKDLPPGAMMEALIENELRGWRDRGLPVDRPELRAIVENKHRQKVESA